MRVVVTPEQVKAIDESALVREELDGIIGRVGDRVCSAVIDILGGTYGRRVNVLLGPGLNGADGAAAARRLERRGVRVHRIPLGALPGTLPPADLTIDALFGIGLNRPFEAPAPGPAPVVAIDLPSGLDATTGEPVGSVLRADHTLALMALKPGLLLGVGPEVSGDVRVLDIGLDPGESTISLVEDGDLGQWLPARSRDAHKWNNAVLVVAGSPGMTGASHLVARAALRSGAGYVHLDSAATEDPGIPTEVVSSLAGKGVRAEMDRFKSLVIGPGLGRSAAAGEFVRTVLTSAEMPAVVDGDGLAALIGHTDAVAGRDAPAVLTPHDGEYRALMGIAPGSDRVEAAHALAKLADAVVLLKGPTTVVADPDGQTLLSTSGDARLATAGTGDVLAGMISAFLARGLPAVRAAAAAAHLHGVAAHCGPPFGLVASDLPDLIPVALSRLRGDSIDDAR